MFGYLHREFTVYALPALLLVRVAASRPWCTADWARKLAWAAAGASVVWGAADLLQRYLLNSSAAVQAEMLMRHACWAPAEWPARLGYALTSVLPVFSGGITTPFFDYSMRSAAVTGGFVWLAWLVFGTLTAMVLRLAWMGRAVLRPASIGVFLTLVGFAAVAAYPLGCDLEVGAPPVLRYLHLVLFVPIGLGAAYLACERVVVFRRAAIGILLVWGCVNFGDNVRVLRATPTTPGPNPHRELADFLEGHGIRHARANFWDAYAVTFLTGERVIVDSLGPIRIPSYTRLVEQASEQVATVDRMPCVGGVRVAGLWCVNVPLPASGQEP
jgi:hypothetical protein